MPRQPTMNWKTCYGAVIAAMTLPVKQLYAQEVSLVVCSGVFHTAVVPFDSSAFFNIL